MESGKKLLTLVASLLFCGAAAGWAAQGKTQAKAAPEKAATTAAAPVAKEPAKHEAKTLTAAGTVVSFTDAQLVLSHKMKGKTEETNFVLESTTQRAGNLEVGAKATVHYRIQNKQNVATMVTVHEAKQPAKSKSTKPKT